MGVDTGPEILQKTRHATAVYGSRLECSHKHIEIGTSISANQRLEAPSFRAGRSHFMGFSPLACAFCLRASCFSFFLFTVAVLAASFLNKLIIELLLRILHDYMIS